MNKKTILAILLGSVIAVSIIIVILAGGPGRFLQGALYNIRPIYRECKIEGANFNSTSVQDCENFHKKLQEKFFPDGEYTIFAKYVDKKLSDNIIPIKITNNKLSCPFTENGYKPLVNVSDPKNVLLSQQVDGRGEIPVGSNGVVVQLNYQKNGQTYFYDTNICESAFQADVLNNNKEELGKALLDFNGFINSRALVNEIFITETPYYSNKSGKAERSFPAGNVYARINPTPDLIFKFTIPCSRDLPTVELPTIETNKNTTITFKGLSQEYLKNCGSRLYLGLQNTNRYDDIQIIENLNLQSDQNNLSNYELKLSEINRVIDKDTVFPITFKVNLHLRDRSDSNEVFTLGSGVLTITSYQAPKIINNTTQFPTSTPVSSSSNNTPKNSENGIVKDQGDQTVVSQEKISEETVESEDDATSTEEKQQESLTLAEPSKVRRMPEPILILPKVTENTAVLEESTEQTTPADSNSSEQEIENTEEVSPENNALPEETEAAME